MQSEVNTLGLASAGTARMFSQRSLITIKIKEISGTGNDVFNNTTAFTDRAAWFTHLLLNAAIRIITDPN